VVRTRQLDAFARNKRHPSVVMWCVANEPMPANLRLAGGVGGDQPGPTVERGRQCLDTNLYRGWYVSDEAVVMLECELDQVWQMLPPRRAACASVG
jgi:hypothetical protein